jgi:flagellar L-ring protein precursor FlgH
MTYKIALTAVSVLFFASSVFSQSGVINGSPTLYNQQTGRPARMVDHSLTFQAPAKQHVFQVEDIIYVHVKDRKTYTNTAANQSKVKVETDAKITAWTKISGLFHMPVPVVGALPEVGGTIDKKTQNQGRMTREETTDFVIPCRITDRRDNGNLIIEGTRSFGIGEERTITTVSGMVRSDTIGPDFKVESNQVADLVILDIPSGNVYDTVRRPWGTRLLEQLKPF